jgi:replication factor A1
MDFCSEPDIHGYHSQTIFIQVQDTIHCKWHYLQSGVYVLWKKGIELVGKSAEALHKQYDPNDTPPEISDLIGHKFTFIVRVLPNKSIWSDNPSFEVIRIKERFGKQPTNPRPKATSIGSKSLSHLSGENLPPLIPITSVDTYHVRSLHLT